MNTEKQKELFERWWYNEGSRPPREGLDLEEHTREMYEIAWLNGAYSQENEQK